MANEPSLSVRVEGLDELFSKLNSLGSAVYRPAIAEAATHVKSVIATYPQQKVGRKQPPVSQKQRIFLIIAIREGQIEVPYRRTGGLGQNWNITFRDNGKTAIVGNSTPGGVYVQGHGKQSVFHKGGGWKTNRQVADQESRKVKEILSRHIAQWAQG